MYPSPKTNPTILSQISLNSKDDIPLPQTDSSAELFESSKIKNEPKDRENIISGRENSTNSEINSGGEQLENSEIQIRSQIRPPVRLQDYINKPNHLSNSKLHII